MKSPRYWTIIILMLLTLGLFYRRGDRDRILPAVPLADFPSQVGPWLGADEPIDPGLLEVMGHGIFLNRLYRPSAPDAQDAHPALGPIALFIGYFPTQRTGQSIHSPQNCLPGAGWTFESASTTTFQDAAGRQRTVGDYVITDGSRRDEVLYWYQSHDRAIASDYKAKIVMIADSIRYNRSDAALVRIVTPIRSGESSQVTHTRLIQFARLLTPQLSTFIPR